MPDLFFFGELGLTFQIHVLHFIEFLKIIYLQDGKFISIDDLLNFVFVRSQQSFIEGFNLTVRVLFTNIFKSWILITHYCNSTTDL